MGIVKSMCLVGATFFSVALACTESCEDVQNLRRDALLSVFYASSHQRRFDACVEMVVDHIEERSLEDRDILMEKIQEEGLRQWPKERQMGLLRSLIGPDSFYSYFESHYLKGGGTYSRRVFMGPAIEVYAALTGGIEDGDEKGNKVVYPVYHRAGLDILAEQANPVDFLLFKLVSKGRRVGHYFARENFFSGMAKIILFEALRQKAREEGQMPAFNRFARKIKLGFQLPEREMVGVGADSDFRYTVHDGYFLGARPHHMDIDSPESQVSFDCTSFVQFCAFGRESFKRLKVITYDFVEVGIQSPPQSSRQAIAMKAIREHFQVELLKCESQLIPGDMIVLRGHMMIFKGYERGENGVLVLKTIEAVGGANRGVGEFTRRVYNPECNQFVWKRDQVFSGEEVAAYIVRFKG